MHWSFRVVVAYSQIMVTDEALRKTGSMWTDVHVRQGFVWRPNAAVFFATLDEGGDVPVEVLLRDELGVGLDALRAIRAPFVVTSGRVTIGFTTTRTLDVPPGEYDVLFETGRTEPAEGMWCRFTFAPASGQSAAIVRQDAELDPPAQLVMDAEPV